MKSKIETYALTVCLVAVVGLTASSGFALYSVMRLVAPDMLMSGWNHQMFVSNDEYWGFKNRQGRSDEQPLTRPPESELTKEREAKHIIALAEERHDAEKDLLRSLSFGIAAGVAFYLHWQLVRKLRTGPPETANLGPAPVLQSNYRLDRTGGASSFGQGQGVIDDRDKVPSLNFFPGAARRSTGALGEHETPPCSPGHCYCRSLRLWGSCRAAALGRSVLICDAARRMLLPHSLFTAAE